MARVAVCREEALALAGSEEPLADGLLHGWALIHEMPRHLLKEKALAERIAWMPPGIEEALKTNKAFEKLTPEEMLKLWGLIDGKEKAEP